MEVKAKAEQDFSSIKSYADRKISTVKNKLMTIHL